MLRRTTECQVDLDCPRGSMCATDGAYSGNYCRTGGPIVIGFLGSKSDDPTTMARRQALDFGRWIVERDPSLRVLGRGVTVHQEFDLGDVGEAAAATTHVLNANVVAMIGPETSAETVLAQALTLPREILELAPSSAAPSVGTAQPQDPHQRFLLQMVIGVPGFAPTLPLFLTPPNRPPTHDTCLKGIAVVTSNDSLGMGLADAINDKSGAFHKNCLTATASVVTNFKQEADYTSEVDALMGAKNSDGSPTQCMFLATGVDVAGALLRTLAERESSTPSRPAYSAFIGSGTLNDPTFPSVAKSPVANQPSLAEGFYGIDADANPARVQLLDLQALWKAYLDDQKVAAPPVLDSNLAPYAEAMIILELAIEQAGALDDPVAIRDALLDVTEHADGDQIYGPGSVADAIKAIRAARQDGRRAAIDYQGSYSNFEFQPGGFIGTGTMVWRVQGGNVQQDVITFKEEQVAAAGAAPQKDCSVPSP